MSTIAKRGKHLSSTQLTLPTTRAHCSTLTYHSNHVATDDEHIDVEGLGDQAEGDEDPTLADDFGAEEGEAGIEEELENLVLGQLGLDREEVEEQLSEYANSLYGFVDVLPRFVDSILLLLRITSYYFILLLLLPIAPSVSCSCVAALNARSSNTRCLLLDTTRLR